MSGLKNINKDLIRARLSKYTKKAYQMLPKIDKPRILDFGCGSGVPTIELAKLSNGEVIGVDIDKDLLNKLVKKLDEEGLSDRVKTMECSMFDFDFPNESFDIIWSEGSISRIGFNKGLKDWRRFIKPNGYLVVHDEMINLTKKFEQISSCGYELLGYFTLSEDVWWSDYYGPLEKRIYEIQKKSNNNRGLHLELEREQREIDMFKSNPKSYCSVFLVMQKV